MDISIVIIVKDGVKTMEKCLKALAAFDDVVVFDNGSTDGTQGICRAFSNVNLVEGEFIGFGPTKRLASTYAKHDWILSLDSDEIVTNTFVNTLRSKSLDKDTVYSIKRVNYYKDIEIKHGWSNDILPRLYNRTKTNISEKMVHEGVVTDNMKVEYLNISLKHLRYTSISEFIIKADRYSTLFAEQNVGKRDSSPLKAIGSSSFTFIRKYFFKLGFLDGYPGLIMAYSNMIENFYKYMKLYEKNEELEK
ncbi:glycosyltransferase family 2 protein [Sulfurovum sp. NBC37-1]|uniref:glycosyltransferase family 2 protein n=1 Tax=Sulfurovum sp. (strain NBC37-1) TaxID=387093 RepID=UPI0001587CE6|nr:glycosyltransferase family 2 protein [Sulfurovum sp. NBC37-1]BAF72889.1 glycosyl transferase [Sulfurovum sp. NBC37-1]